MAINFICLSLAAIGIGIPADRLGFHRLFMDGNLWLIRTSPGISITSASEDPHAESS
jgi:hypothetical protein